LGAPLALVLLAPLLWFLFSTRAAGALLIPLKIVVLALFLSFSTLIGATVTRPSPIDRDPPV
jgi:hypothetical protein